MQENVLYLKGKCWAKTENTASKPLPVLKGQRPVVLVAVHEWPHVERDIGKTLVHQRLRVRRFELVEAFTLVMKDQGDEVELRPRLVAGFVDKDGQLAHRANPLRYPTQRPRP